MHFRILVALLLIAPFGASAQEEGAGGVTPSDRDRQIRDRYEQVLERDPLQAAAFDRVYESYMLTDGVEAWLARLAPAEGAEDPVARKILRGRILARQFRVPEALELLASARAAGATGPALEALLGRLYYESGQDNEAISALTTALEGTESPEERAAICRMLGSVYLRAGKRAEAAAAWQRIAELNPGDLFALQELAEICEENRMWEEAIAARRRIIEAAANDPYRRCQAWRAIGQAELERDNHGAAIAAYETGLALAASGNWLHEDLKGRLVGVYESRGDLEGLTAYLEARLAADGADLSMKELLADVWRRRGDGARAEVLLVEIIARAPDRVSAREHLLALQREQGRVDDAAATLEGLIAQFPAEPVFLQRLGELWLEQKDVEKAKAAWRRVLGDGTDPEAHALLASWYERAEFPAEAAAAYEAALALRPEREWRLRLAGLKFDLGEEEAALAAWLAAAAPEETPAGEIAEVASILLGRQFVAEAEVLYQRAIASDPENLEHVLAYARLLEGKKDHAGALAQYTRLASQDGNEYLKGAGERGMLDAHAALGTLDQQRATWEAAIQENSGDVAARERLAGLLARGGNRPGVVKLYEECVELAPDRLDLRRQLAAAYRENRENEKAIAAYEELLARDGARASVYLRDLLALYETLGRGEESLRAAERLVELSPASPEAITALARVYLSQGETEKGLQQYRNLIQIDGDTPTHYRDFGDALQSAGRLGEAQEIYRKMLEIAGDPSARLEAVGRLAMVYVRNGQGEALIAEFQRRLTATPRDLSAYEALAAIYRAAGNPQGALETLERARGEVEDEAAAIRLVMAEAAQNGDYQRVVAMHEALLARSAAPTAGDLDRLGQAHALAGQLEEAHAVWRRMANENKEDVTVQLTAARRLEENGLNEEAGEFVERALALDPYDYAVRFSHAQRLLLVNEVDRALEQLQQILDIGPRPAGAAAAASAGAPPAAFSPGAPQMYSSRITPGGFQGGRSRQQSFDEIRQMVAQHLVQIARQYDDVESPLETYQKRMDAEPENVDLRRNFLLLCDAAGEIERGLETARALRAIQPGDTTLSWRIVQYLQQLERLDEAIEEARSLADGADANAHRQAQFTLIHLMAGLGQVDEAVARIDGLQAEPSERARMYLQVASSLVSTGDKERVFPLYEKAAELDPNLLHDIMTGRARLLQEAGDLEGARALYVEAAFTPNSARQPQPQGQQRMQTPLYLPQPQGRGRQTMNNITMLPGYNFGYMDHQRAEALNQAWRLLQEPGQFEPVLERLREAASAYGSATTDEGRNEARQYLYFYVAVLRNMGREVEASEFIERQMAGRPTDILLLNLALHLLDAQERYDDMLALYEQFEAADPASAGDVARAALQIALLRGKADEVVARYRALPDTGQQSLMPGRSPINLRLNQINAVVRTLENAGEQAEARALLEEELGRSRDTYLLGQLSRICSAAGEHDQAIEYAREVYERQGIARARSRSNPYSMNGMSLQALGLNDLDLLWRTYRAAGRGEELINEFRERVTAQPASTSLRQSLVALLVENGQMELALREMEQLVALRPNDRTLKIRRAGLMEANGDAAGALALLEEIIASRSLPDRGLRREVARLYKELGREEELARFRDQMIDQSRNSDELQEMARELARENDFTRAAELMARARRIEPGNVWLGYQEADFRWQADDRAGAAELYLQMIRPSRGQGPFHMDPRQIDTVITRLAEVGRLEELKALAGSAAPDPYTARTMTILSALIARHEKRPEEAEQLLRALPGHDSDEQVCGLLAALAEDRGDISAAIAVLEAGIRAQGHGDFQRLARLALKQGDTEKALKYLRQFAALTGHQGHVEALRVLAEAGHHEQAAVYFREVYPAIGKTDHVREQLAEMVFNANRTTGHYDRVIDEVVFAPGELNVTDLARKYTGDFHELPGLALRRIEPLLARFPEDGELQALHTEILEQLGDTEKALAYFQSMQQDETFFKEHGKNYARLARESSDRALWHQFALKRLEVEEPTQQLINDAFTALVEQGRRAEIPALREGLLARVDSAKHTRMKMDFIRFDAEQGDVTGARAAFLALLEATGGDIEVEREYHRFLMSNQYHQEAIARYLSLPEENRSRVVSPNSAHGLIQVLARYGYSEQAWTLLLRTMNTGTDHRQNGIHQTLRPMMGLSGFDESGLPAESLLRLLESGPPKENYSFADRMARAGTRFQLGQWAPGLALLRENPGPGARELVTYYEAGVPSEQRAELFGEFYGAATPVPQQPDGLPPVSRSQIRERIDRARALAADGRKEEAIAEATAISMEDADMRDVVDRAQFFLQSGAFESALADYDQALKITPGYLQLNGHRAVALACLGRMDEARDAWSKTPRNDVDTIAEYVRVLIDVGAMDEARAQLEVALPDSGSYVNFVLLRAELEFAAGDFAGGVARMEEAYADLGAGGRDRLVNGLSKLLSDKDYWRPLLADAALAGKAPVARGLLRFAQAYVGEGREAVRAEVIQALPPEATLERSAVADYANLVRALPDRAGAVARLMSLANTTQPGGSAAREIFHALAGMGAYDEAVRFALGRDGSASALLDDYGIDHLSLMAHLSDAALRDTVLAGKAARAYTESRVLYLDCIRARFGGDMDGYRQRVETLLEHPAAQSKDLMILAYNLDEDGEQELRGRILVRIVRTAEYDDRDRIEAATRLAGHFAVTGDLDGLLDLLIEIPADLPLRAGDFWKHAFDAARAVPFETADAAILARIQAYPEHERVSDLIALRARVAEDQGLTAPEGGLAALPIPEEEWKEARLLAHAIHDWAASEPVPIETWEAFNAAPEQHVLDAEQGGSMLAPPFDTWVPIGSRDVAPGVPIESTGDFGPRIHENKAAWYLTEIHSPDDRSLTVTFGSPQWAIVRVNGVGCHLNPFQRLYLPDLDRFEIPLKAGVNRVLVRGFDNDGEGTAFTLSIASGGEGLQIRAPELPPPAAAGSPDS